jgi:formylglycine-generating enzyme required for sulfatase activity
MAFCGWLSHQLGYEVRLPAEKEWEQAARGREGREYPWGKEYQPGYANINETYGDVGPHNLGRTSPVGMYPQGATPEGVMDLAGNVWEWCLNEYEKPKRTERSGTEARVVRGGSWFNFHDFARASYRYFDHPVNRIVGLGFRVVCSAPIPAGR